MATINATVNREDILRLVKQELRAGGYTTQQLIGLSNAAANEVYAREPERVQVIFRNSKRLFVKYWEQFKSPLALRRKREEAILALEKLNGRSVNEG